MTNSVRILIVDDNWEDLLLFRILVNRYAETYPDDELSVDEVASAEEALNQLKLTTYDLVLMDQKMPRVSGSQALQMIRNAVLPSQPPVVSYSNCGRSVLTSEAQLSGFSAVVTKYMNVGELHDMLRLVAR